MHESFEFPFPIPSRIISKRFGGSTLAASIEKCRREKRDTGVSQFVERM